MFGLAFTVAPFAMVLGISVVKTHQYSPQIWIAWSLSLIGIGLLITIDRETPRAHTIGFEVIAGSGLGMMTGALFFPILAPLPVESNAHALSLYMFLRNFSNVSSTHSLYENFII